VRAITVIPEKQGSVALSEMPEPPERDGPVLVQTQAVGICGTDLEIINGEYGTAPPITRQVPLSGWAQAYVREPDDIKTVLRFTA
jgi:threonine dehydrogenase-like Zn-dependent dehydrogenase